MTPYYQDAAVTIYHGDCREIVTRGIIERGSAIITDQPYGTGWIRGGGSVGQFTPRHIKPDWDVWDLDWIELVRDIVSSFAIFCPVKLIDELANKFSLRSVHYYRKTNVRPGGIDREAIVVSPINEAGDFETYNGDMPLHPCQKPSDLMSWMVHSFSGSKQEIVDPFMGSGTTLRAAKDLGRKAIGIEIEERYCEIAAKRMAQEVFSFT